MIRTLGIVLLVLPIAIGIWFVWPKTNTTTTTDTPSLTPHLMAEDSITIIDGAKVRIRQQGPENAPVVILIHGFMHSLELWDFWADNLKEDYRVIRYDLLGHGYSGPDETKRYSPQERSDFHIKVMDELDVQSAHLAGNSLGGTIAWRAAASNPERVLSLTLINAGIFDFSGVENEPGKLPAAAEFSIKTAPMPAVKYMMKSIYANFDDLSNERLEQIQYMMQLPGNGQAFLDHISEFTMPDPTEILGQISTSTLILWGELDTLIPVEHAHRANDTLSNSQIAIIPGAGHALPEDAPRESLDKFVAFLKEVQ